MHPYSRAPQHPRLLSPPHTHTATRPDPDTPPPTHSRAAAEALASAFAPSLAAGRAVEVTNPRWLAFHLARVPRHTLLIVQQVTCAAAVQPRGHRRTQPHLMVLSVSASSIAKRRSSQLPTVPIMVVRNSSTLRYRWGTHVQRDQTIRGMHTVMVVAGKPFAAFATRFACFIQTHKSSRARDAHICVSQHGAAQRVREVPQAGRPTPCGWPRSAPDPCATGQAWAYNGNNADAGFRPNA